MTTGHSAIEGFVRRGASSITPLLGRLDRITLPEPVRPHATLTVLDLNEANVDPTGAVRDYWREKADYVAPRQHLQHVLITSGIRDRIIDQEGARWYQLRETSSAPQIRRRSAITSRTLRRIAIHEQPDIVEVGNPYLIPLIATWATRHLRSRLVHFYQRRHLSRFTQPLCSSLPARIVNRVAGSYIRAIDSLFDATIVASDFAAAELASVGVDRTIHVPAAVDTDHFTPTRRSLRRATRFREGLGEGPIAAYVGDFSREKDLESLVQAWNGLPHSHNASLILVGDGIIRERVLAKSRTSRISWIPYLRDRERLADLLAAVDLFIAPGPAETVGRCALEALSSGTPILSAHTGAVAELVQRSGAGRLFEASCPESLAEEAAALLSSDLSALGRRGRAYVCREHAWERVLNRLFQIYAAISPQ